MTEENSSKNPESHRYKPIYEKVIPAAVITLVVVGILMLILAAAIALGFIGVG